MKLKATLTLTAEDVANVIRTMCEKEGYTVLEMPELAFDELEILARPMSPEEKHVRGLDPRSSGEILVDAVKATIRSEFDRLSSGQVMITPSTMEGRVVEEVEATERAPEPPPKEESEAQHEEEPFDPDAPFYPKTELKIPMQDLSERNKKLAAIRAEAEGHIDPYDGQRDENGYVTLKRTP